MINYLLQEYHKRLGDALLRNLPGAVSLAVIEKLYAEMEQRIAALAPMTPEQMQELTSLRQYKVETDVYVQKLEDIQTEHQRIIKHQAQQIEQLRFAVNRLQDAAITRVKAVHELEVELGTIDRLDVVNQWD